MSVLSGEPSGGGPQRGGELPTTQCGVRVRRPERVQHGVGPEVGRPEVLPKPVDGRAVGQGQYLIARLRARSAPRLRLRCSLAVASRWSSRHRARTGSPRVGTAG